MVIIVHESSIFALQVHQFVVSDRQCILHLPGEFLITAVVVEFVQVCRIEELLEGLSGTLFHGLYHTVV